MTYESVPGGYTEPVPSIYSLKPSFQGLLRPSVSLLARAGITANQITVLTCLLSAGVGVLTAWRIRSRAPLLLLPAFFLVRMALNAMDGILAREFNQKSALGAYLNELCDVVSDAFLYLPFALLPAFDPLWMGVVIVLAVISEMAGTIGGSRRYDGPMGKSDRALVFGALALWIGVGWNVVPWVSWLFPRLMALLLAVTIVNRVRNGLAESRISQTRRGSC
jgi:CDP-diacylglycerol---glycerol-3-phosphate 3-phosphatidyltransferase